MKAITKAICIFLAVIMIFSVTVSAERQDSQSSTYSLFFVGYSTYCWKTSENQFQVWFDVSARGIMDKLGVEKIKIQKSSDNESWLTVMTFSSSYYEHLLCDNTGFHSDHVTYTGASGFYYRAYVTFYAENSSGIGKTFEYTQPIYLGS